MIWPNSSLPPIEGALTSPFPPLPQLSFSCSSATFILHQLLCSDPPLQTDSIISHPKKKINFCSAREVNSTRECSQEQESGKGKRLPLFFKKLLHQFSSTWKKNFDPQFSHFSQNGEYTGQNMLIIFWSTLSLSFQRSAAGRISNNYLWCQ